MSGKYYVVNPDRSQPINRTVRVSGPFLSRAGAQDRADSLVRLGYSATVIFSNSYPTLLQPGEVAEDDGEEFSTSWGK